MSTIIVYSGGSNTKAVADYIAQKTGGKAVTTQEASGMDLGAYDKVVIGTRVRAGRIPSDISEYVSKNKSVIDQKSPAFYLCCMYNDDKGQNQVEKIASELGIPKCVFFNKGKKIVKEADNPVDAFIASL
jgi:menaquinone-dependent protoporphyrinogen oxidase